MADISFSDWVAGLGVDTLTGSEKIPMLDGTLSIHTTASLLSAFVIDQLHQASVITTLNDTDELNVFRTDVERILTAQNFFNWIVDKLEAIDISPSIVSGDRLIFSDGGVLRQIDIDNVRTYLNSSVAALGAEIAALPVATLTDADQYVVSQVSTARKTTFSAIAARVHAQFLAYVATLPSVVTLAGTDYFYVNDGGVASRVDASVVAAYVQSQVGASIVSAAWDTYSPLGAAANATDVFLLERAGVGRTATGANLASYVIGTQNSATDAVSTVAGDDFLIFRSGTQFKLDVALLSTYVLATGWSAANGSPVVTGDRVLIGRSGTSLHVTVDQLRTFMLVGIQASVLDLTGLTTATLAPTSIFLIGDGTTPRRTTLADLETRIWADYQTYVSGLTALTVLEDADLFYVIEGSTPRRITASNIAVYVESELWAKVDAVPAIQAGDDLWMRRGANTHRLDVDALAGYVSTAVAGSINIAGLSAATLSDADLFLVNDGGVNRRTALSDLRAHFWTAFVTYVTGLPDAAPVDATDLLYIIGTGAPLRVTVGDLWNTRYVNDARAIKLDDFATPDDNTDLNATASAHGLLPKLSNNNRQFLRGDGVWATYASLTAVSTAAFGSTHLDAAALPATNTTFITSDSAAKGVRLPTGAPGDIMEVINNSAGFSARLYPAVTGSINGLATNAAVVIPANRGVRCFCSATNVWTVFEMEARAAAA